MNVDLIFCVALLAMIMIVLTCKNKAQQGAGPGKGGFIEFISTLIAIALGVAGLIYLSKF